MPRRVVFLLERVLPRSLFRLLHRIYHPYYCWRTRSLTNRLLGLLFPSGDLKVIGGPFQGMRYIGASKGSALVPKLIGSYEAEFHPALHRLFSQTFDVIIDIGCAEGYYLVGLALKFPSAAKYGFDIDSKALRSCRELADANSIEKNFELHGRCTTDLLSALLKSRSLVVCDCEGAERELLDPRTVPGLKNSVILVELHDKIVPGITMLIDQRFASTHHVQILKPCPRDPTDYPAVSRLSREDQQLALNEFRSDDMRWAVLLPHSNFPGTEASVP